MGMKIDRHGQAKILTPEEIQFLFTEGLTTPRDRALFGICLYTACRIREACTLRTADVYDRKGSVRPEIIIRKSSTKGKLATRTLPVIEELRSLLVNYYPTPRTWFLFPGRHGEGHIHPDAAARLLERLTKLVGMEVESSGPCHGQAARTRRTLGRNRTAATARTAQAPGRSPPHLRPSRANRHHLRAQKRHPLGNAAPGNGLRLRHELLASAARVAPSRRLVAADATAAATPQ